VGHCLGTFRAVNFSDPNNNNNNNNNNNEEEEEETNNNNETKETKIQEFVCGDTTN
jgi:hypothetical protein